MEGTFIDDAIHLVASLIHQWRRHPWMAGISMDGDTKHRRRQQPHLPLIVAILKLGRPAHGAMLLWGRIANYAMS